MRLSLAVLVACAVAAGCGGERGGRPTGATPPSSSACPSPRPPDPVPRASTWTWETVNAPYPEVESVFVDPEDEGTLYAGGAFGLFASTDAGATWRLAVGGFINTNAVGFLPASSCTVFAAGGNVLQRSDDRGRTWHAVKAFPDSVRSIHVGRDSHHLYVGPQVDPRSSQSPDGIWVSADLGANWSLSPLPTTARGLIPWDIEEDASGVLYTGTEISDHPQPYRPPYYRSVDSGRAWEDVTGALPWHVSNSVAHPTRPIVYALTEGAGLYVTEDQGLNWSRRGTTSYVLELTLDPRAPEVLYAGDHTAGGRAGGAYVSTDEGRTFHSIGLEGRIVGSLALSGTGSRLYAASYQSGLSRAVVPAPR